MKKILYFLGALALMAGFVSCDKEEGEDDGNSKKAKKLTKVVDGSSYYSFVYDESGRCSSYYDSSEEETAKYTYYDGKIVEEVCLPDGDVRVTTTLTLNSDGYVKSMKVENGGAEITVYSYDNQGQLVSETVSDEDGYTRTSKYTWENGNITKVETHEQEDDDESFDLVYFLEYTNSANPTPIENKVGFTIMQFEGDYSTPYTMIGTSLKNLPVGIKYTVFGEEYTSTLTWTLDADGYPTKMLSKERNYESSVEFVWE